jgi:hypothetical protein
VILRRQLLYLAITFLALAAGICWRWVDHHAVEANDKVQRYVITIPGCPFAAHPIAVHAKTRLDALLQLHATVWTEKEWADAQPSLDGIEFCGVLNPQPKSMDTP